MDPLGHTERFLGMGGDVVAHVDDVGGLVANLTGKLYGLPNGLMGSVGAVAQSVHHKQPDTGKQFQGAGRNGGHVSDIGHVADAVSKDGQLAVHYLQGGYLGIVHQNRVIGLEIVQLDVALRDTCFPPDNKADAGADGKQHRGQHIWAANGHS